MNDLLPRAAIREMPKLAKALKDKARATERVVLSDEPAAPETPASGSNLAAPRKRKVLVRDDPARLVTSSRRLLTVWQDELLALAGLASDAAQARVDTKLERLRGRTVGRFGADEHL